MFGFSDLRDDHHNKPDHLELQFKLSFKFFQEVP